jgi:hypothetical protein
MVLYMAFHALFITQIIALVVIDRLIYASMRVLPFRIRFPAQSRGSTPQGCEYRHFRGYQSLKSASPPNPREAHSERAGSSDGELLPSNIFRSLGG